MSKKNDATVCFSLDRALMDRLRALAEEDFMTPTAKARQILARALRAGQRELDLDLRAERELQVAEPATGYATEGGPR